MIPRAWSAVIPVCARTEALYGSFQSAYESLGPHIPEIITVENGSDRLKSVRKHWDSEPIGYARAVNAGLALSKSKLVMVLNSDAIIGTPDWMTPIEEILMSDPKVGIVIPWLINDGEGQFSVQMVGACWAVRRAMLNEIGVLSEEYGAGYYEDADLFIRAQDAGWKIRSCESVKAIHAGQSTFKELYPKAEIDSLSSTNYEKYVAKWGQRWATFD